MKQLVFTKRLSIALSALVCSFSVIAAVTSTYAWFTSQSSVEATGMSVSIIHSELMEDYEIYNIQEIDGNNMYFSQTDTKNNFTIGQLSDLNTLHAALVKINLKKDKDGNNYQNIELSVQTATDRYLGQNDAPYFNDAAFTDWTKFSSVGQYYYVDTVTNNGSRFVVSNNDIETKCSLVNDTQTSLVDAKTAVLKDVCGGDSIYFVIDYDLNSIAKIYSRNLGYNEPTGGIQYSFDISFTLTLV